MGLDVRVAARAEDLLPPLLAWLDAPRADPFASDLVVVPNAGVRSWLGTAVADHAGILAGVEFVFPAELRARLLDLPDAATDPWRPERLAWEVLAVVSGPDAPRGLPWAGPAARPWSLARRVADLLDRTATQRPAMVAGWARGEDGGWQAEVWRRVRTRIGVASPAERLLDPVTPRPAAIRLPDRLAVVGIGDLAPATATLLRRVAEDREVLVLAPVPSPALLGRAAGTAPSDPLLASWGRAAVAAAGVLDGLGARPLDVAPRVDIAPRVDVADAVTDQLARLRAGVAADRGAAPVPRGVRDDGRGGDGSVQVHACHGLVRQLEVLRDALLHALEDDHRLEPRDVLVLCPDLRRVAPLVGPILGADVAGHRLPVRVADRAALGPTPVVGALEALLDVAAGRAERDEVLALLALPVVRTALGLGDDDLALLERAADELDLRWGVDAAHRERWGYPHDVASGTWREGMDRLLAGVLLHPSGDVVAGLAPAVDVRAQDVPALARLADAVRALRDLVGLAGSPRPMDGWAPTLLAVVDRWLLPPRADDDVHHAQAVGAGAVRAAVRSLAADAVAAGVAVPLDLLEVRAALLDRVASGGGGADPRGGSVTVASLTPLRGVPARIVAVVDVGAIATPAPADADDLLAAAPLPGERDPRDEPRAGLLDAVLAARSRLILTCDGQDVRTGTELPLPTAVEELLDAVPDVGGDAPLVVRHPRHLADPRGLGGDAGLARLTGGRPWTFQPWALRAATALASDRGAEPGLRAAALAGSAVVVGTLASVSAPSDAPTVLTLDALRDALTRPARAWLRHGLGLRLPPEVELPPRALPVWLGRRDDGLVRWQLGDELLRHVESGGDPERWLAARPARGGLPPGRLGQRLLDEVHAEVAAIHAAAGDGADGTVTRLLLAVDVGGVRVEGVLALRDGRVVDTGVQSDHPSHVVRAWLGLLLARAAGADEVRGATVVRRGGEDGPVVRRLDVTVDAAPAALATAVDLALRARSGPLALLPRTAWRLADPDRTEAAVAEDLARDLRAPEPLLVHGPLTPDDLTVLAAGPPEEGLPDDGPAAHRVAAVLVGAVLASTGAVPWSGADGDGA